MKYDGAKALFFIIYVQILNIDKEWKTHGKSFHSIFPFSEKRGAVNIKLISLYEPPISGAIVDKIFLLLRDIIFYI